MKPFFPVNEPLLIGNEKKYLADCIDTGWISSEGPFVKKLEDGMAEICDRQYGIAVCNGSVALDVALAAINISDGDEVILPSFTIVSCGLAVVRAGGTPVFVDCEPETWNMSMDQVKKAITPKTKAIMVVHIYGLPTDMDTISDIAQKNNLRVIEDAAEAHGLRYKGNPCGSFGDISTFSFYPNKHVTTGEGGMVLTNDPDIADRCKSLRNLFFGKVDRYIHEDWGWNFRMSNLQAAVGVAQLEKLPEFIIKKKNMGKYYTKIFSDIPKIQLPLMQTKDADNIYWVYGIILKEEFGSSVAEIRTALQQEGIGTRPFFYPLHKQPIFKDLCPKQSLPVSEFLEARGFYIPSGLALSKQDVEEVGIRVKKVLTLHYN